MNKQKGGQAMAKKKVQNRGMLKVKGLDINQQDDDSHRFELRPSVTDRKTQA